ncbi:Sperm flagellar protein 1 [Orchesella cincta]|uniref:Sperm flagellar protein 1 n=1 Tax=Orchesella cincta TaxID=48709 RepID=A0A1D2N5Y3_ORCCI|nr:Sperm flagellar protein 1 [Orchesella cincta]
MKPKKMNNYTRLRTEEARKRAAEEEAEREKLAAAEEARLASLARLAEEEARLKQVTTVPVTKEEKRKDLLAWLRSIPLSDKFFDRIDRVFSSGVLIAEVINYFCPDICDKRQYFQWNSSKNKQSNWEALNYKVFPKLGFRLNGKHIANILNPFSCGKFQKNCERGFFIYKLLFRIRDKLAELNPSVFDYRSLSYVPPSTSCTDNNCETTKRPPKRELRNMLDNPCYSKIELLIASGYYDEKEIEKRQKEKEQRDREKAKNSSTSFSSHCTIMDAPEEVC